MSPNRAVWFHILKQTNGQHRTCDVTPSQIINKKTLVQFSGQSVLMSQSLDDFLMFQATLEQMDRAFFGHGLLSFVFSVMVFWGLSNFVTLQFSKVPYGCYSRAGWGVPVPARLAWFFQELPSFVVPLLISLGSYGDFQNLHAHNKTLIGCFLLHYFLR